MNVPKNYPISKDIYDRRDGQKPGIGEKVRDVSIAVRNDWNQMKENERQRKGIQDTKKVNGKLYPSFKKGGKVKKTGLIYAHKGERVVPKKSGGKK